MVFPALGVIDLADGAKIKWIGYQCVQGIGGDGYHLSEANCRLGAVQCFHGWRLRIDIDEICSHAVSVTCGP